MMQSKSTYGKPPEPDFQTANGMKDRGIEVAAICRDARKNRISSNPKSKIVSYLRWALNKGIDDYNIHDLNHTVQQRPSRAEVTKWANIEAREVMDSTYDNRRTRNFSAFGSGVERSLKRAYKKGWGICAGSAELFDELLRESFNAVTYAVPQKYLDTFLHIASCKARREKPMSLYILEERKNECYNKGIYLPTIVNLYTKEGKVFIKNIEQIEFPPTNPVSGACVQALEKHGLLSFGQFELKNGGVYHFCDLTQAGMILARDAIAARLSDNKKFRASKEGRDRQQIMDQAFAIMGIRRESFPDPDESTLDDFARFFDY